MTSRAVPVLPRIAVPLVAAATLLPWVSAGAALVAGIAIALTLGNPWPRQARELARRTLMWSVVGLGAGMDLGVVGRVGLHGLGYTAIGIVCALGLGTWLGRRLGVERDVSLLVCVGTAICGGSAIAAVAPVIRAKEHHVSMALATVFLLNAIALFAFPAIGHRLDLTPDAFGLWSALAIHDTSSVVGAAQQFGPRALEIATAAKLARALWIVPVGLGIAFYRMRSAAPGLPPTQRPALPWFIVGFVAMAAVFTWCPGLHGVGAAVTWLAHRALATTLFLIGLGLSRSTLRALGARPLIQAVVLWFGLAAGTLVAIELGWIG